MAREISPRPRFKARRGCRNRGERNTPYVLGGLECAKKRGCVTWRDIESPVAAGARGTDRDRAGNRAGGDRRIDAAESRHGAEDGAELAFYRGDGADRQGLRQLDGHVALTNQKLRRRGARILEEAAGVNCVRAEHALRQAGHDLPAALVMLKTGAAAAKRGAATCGSRGGNVATGARNCIVKARE